MNVPEPQAGRRLAAVLPYFLAFLASACVMLVEVVASRMLSRHVGASLYSWTSIIGVVLGGITIGNFVGGRLADRYPSRTLLAVLFFLAGAVCLAIPYLDLQVANWSQWNRVSYTYWPWRVARQVMGVLLVPATLLGTIGPVVARWAIDRGYATGRTVGNIYAWGALGSIVGTFAAGFWLIELLGSAGAVFTAGAVLIACGCLLGARAVTPVFVVAWPLVAGAVMSHHIVTYGSFREWSWALGAESRSTRPRLEDREAPGRLYSAESNYSFIKVIEEKNFNELDLCLDNLVHARYVPAKTILLSYDYEKIYAGVTLRFGKGLDAPSSLFLGGGGYIFPRWMQEIWPRGWIHVAEIDPAVTEACFHAFHLRREHCLIRPRLGFAASGGTGDPGQFVATDAILPRPMEIFHLDARNHVEDLVRLKRAFPLAFRPFDYIYGDAFNDYSVPFHLVTREFVGKVKELLTPETGIYMQNVIDIFAVGKFLGAIYNTVGSQFPHVYIYATAPNGPNMSPVGRDTFIVIGAMREIDLNDLGRREGEIPFDGTFLRPEHLRILSDRSGGLILTDDFSPVENLLEEVVRRKSQI